jgi:hypothetical protein
LPFVAEKLVSIEPMFETKIGFESHVLKGFDAVIATGSNNSARYFDYYFGKYPHIIRQNRHSVAIITGNEGTDRLKELGKDVFNYFGLGCRNVSKVLLPENYPIPQLLDQFQSYYSILQHNKYVNNYEYNKSLYLINKQAHLDTGFLLLVENTALSSPVGVLHYEYYSDLNTAIRQLKTMEDQIQCVLSEEKGVNNAIIFGESQKPGLMDYADNVDVMRFLGGLSK